MADNIELTLQVGQDDADPDDVDRDTRRLRAELQELPIESASLVAAKTPAGAKAGDAVTLGALVVSLAPVVVPALVEFLKSWMARKEGRTIVVKRKGTEFQIKAPLSEAAIARLVEQLAGTPHPAPRKHRT
jgi:hypothetical protein